MIRRVTPSDSPPLPLLITGLASVVGYNAFHYFYRKYPGHVFGMRRADNWPLRGDGIIGCNMEDFDCLKRAFDRYRFVSVLNCGGSCKLKSCELDPAMTWRANVMGVENLVRVIAGSDVRLVHLSIDLVYSGEKGGAHVERDLTDPVTVYGKTMVIAEQCVLSGRPDACVLRISLPMGISFNGHAGAIDWIQSRFKKSKPATLYYDEIRTPVYTDCLNRMFDCVLAKQLKGLYHAGGPRPLSLYQIAQIVNRIGGYSPEHLIGCSRHEAGPIPPRAGDVTLDSQKLARALGFQPFDPWPLYDEHAPTHAQWHWEQRRDERGSLELLSEVLYRNPRRAQSP